MDLPLEHAQNGVLEDHNSQNIAIPTHATPALASLPQPEEDTLVPSPSLPPQAPQPRNSRHQASVSPLSPSTIRRRAILRARRNRGLTSFERAAKLFARVERRRLMFEEAHEKRHHEREMEWLRQEAERIDVSRARNNLFHQMTLLVEQLVDVIRRQRPSS